MKRFESYGQGVPGLELGDLSGWLIVVEGPDGVGRTTHVNRLRAIAPVSEKEALA